MRREGGWKRQSRWTNPELEARTRTRNKNNRLFCHSLNASHSERLTEDEQKSPLTHIWGVSERQTDSERRETPRTQSQENAFSLPPPSIFFLPRFLGCSSWEECGGSIFQARRMFPKSAKRKSVCECVFACMRVCVCVCAVLSGVTSACLAALCDTSAN